MPKKKKIIFMLINMNIGGTEKALLNMISEMPQQKYDITIIMLERYGGFLDSIPDWVHVHYLDGYKDIKEILNNPPKMVLTQLVKKRKFSKAFMLLILFLISKLQHNRSILYKYILHRYPEIKMEYDIAVAYAGPMDFISFFVAKKINAKKKIQWIHFDVNQIGFNYKFAKKIYSQFDKIFVVSKEAKDKLLNKIPPLSERVEVMKNIVSPELITLQSNCKLGFDDQTTNIKILTVGRLSYEKGQDIAVRVVAKLIRDGYNVKWYCIGEGNFRYECEQLVEKYNLKDYFIFLGAKINPYPYIKNCDIYVQPSRYEGYCVTLIEAKCLCKPIVTTDVNGANELINNEENGFVVKIDEAGIYNAVAKLIDNSSLRIKFSTNLANEEYHSNVEMKKLYTFIG